MIISSNFGLIPMLRSSLARLSLLAKFSIVSLLVTLLIAIGLAAWLEDRLQRDALWAVAENAEQQVTGVLNPMMLVSDFQSPLFSSRYSAIDELIHETLLISDIVRIKIWNREGVQIYSDDPGLVGQTFPISEELHSALSGRMSTEISDLEKEENINERDQFPRLFEVYIPLIPDGGTEILGAYEVYYDLNQLEPRLLRIRRAVWTGVGMGFLVLYLSLFFLLRNPSRELIQRNEENRRLLLAEREQRQLSETLGRVSLAISGELDLRNLLDLICRESTQVFDTQAAYLWLVEDQDLVGFAAHGQGAEKFIGMRYSLQDPILLGARIARERTPMLINDAPHSDQVDQKLIKLFDIQSILGAPLIKGERVLGSLMIIERLHPHRFRHQDLDRVSLFSSHAAIAIDNAQLFEEARRHLEHEKALREIDLAITSNTNLNNVLDTVIERACDQLHVDAGAIFLVNGTPARMELRRGLGFQNNGFEGLELHAGSKLFAEKIDQRQIFGQANIVGMGGSSDRLQGFDSENFTGWFAAPLYSKDQLLGVLAVFHRSPLIVNSDWMNFFETLAGQAAIALDNAKLFADLEKSNSDLSQAYEAAIEGWSAALDLRDRETEGHTQRVTQMTLRLARKIGLSAEELIHIRRGALLHDIGKMGVPDRILLKSQELTEDEWTHMRRHPSYAYDLLKSITYLSTALDIPHYHHEKWDGTGYPEGLKGDQIPLAARIFAVADVYDALSSDRPYRSKWPKQKVLEYIHSLSGKQFDPKIVESFLEIINES